jgi:hypothetical protein
MDKFSLEEFTSQRMIIEIIQLPVDRYSLIARMYLSAERFTASLASCT